MQVSRRTFLKLAGVSAAAAALYESSGSILSALSLIDETTPPGEEVWAPSVCQLCPAGCGILVRVIDDAAVKIEGNPLNPNNQGRLCPRGQAGLQILYNPDRIEGPLRRVGERGAGEWQSISWDNAIKLAAGKLKDLRDNGQPHTFVFIHGAKPGLMHDLIGRFCQAFGTPNAVEIAISSTGSSPLVHYLMQGWRACAGYNWENTNYLLSFGASLLEAQQPSVRMLQAYSRLRRGRPGARAKIVQIESRFSVTAAKADEWIPIKPGAEGALALSMARVIVEEGLYDRDFIENHSFGFEDWTGEDGEEHIGFKTLVLESYSPGTVSAVTGIPMETIKRVAREFAATRPAVALGDVSWQTNGLFAQMAVHALNALVGSIDVPGGIIRQEDPPFAPWPETAEDGVASQGLAMPRLDRADTREYPLANGMYETLPESILADDPYPANAIFLYQADPLFDSPDPDRFYKALPKVPFIVSFSPFMDDSTSYADLILPDHTYLEGWSDDVLVPSLGYPVLGLGQPAVRPLYDTRNAGDVLIQLTKELGSTMAESFPWLNFEELLRFRLRDIFEAGRGSIVADTFDQFWDEFQERGVWSAPPYRFGEWERVLTLPSGKFEFYSQNLKHTLEALVAREAAEKGTTAEEEMEEMLQDLGLRARGDELYMPHYEFPRWVGEETEYPFHLNVYQLMTLLDGRMANSPWLQEIYGLHIKESWGSWVEINPEAAKELGIADGDPVWVESPVGRIQARAWLYPGAMPEVVNMPLGQGHTAYGRWAKGQGTNPKRIIGNEYDYLGGQAAWLSTRVRIYKA
ncbi:MAG: twin-arginine translocation signal domain-containing protein [Anaerolineales bacterium]|nr:MAG: twin-arginine translocation signal domain-containing protein [Anaerolineales bacterium]